MINRNTSVEVVFTPENEPYLGRESVLHFDQVILSCLKQNAAISAFTQLNSAYLSDLQRSACQIIPQGVNLALTIRELVRQAYLFGAVVLVRPLIERAAIISYLHEHRDAITLWQDGWKHSERPSLTQMLQSMAGQDDIDQAKNICGAFNHVIHGDPIGASFNLVNLGDGGLGYSVGKVVNHPELCDFICFQSYLYLIVLMGRASAIFPEVRGEEEKRLSGSRAPAILLRQGFRRRLFSYGGQVTGQAPGD